MLQRLHLQRLHLRRPHCITQPHCYVLIILLTLEILNGQVIPPRRDRKIEACNSFKKAKNRNAFCNCNATVVDCSRRSSTLNAVPDKIIPTIKALYLNENEIVNIQEHDFIDFELLEQLFLQENKISSIHPNAFKRLFKLKILNLSNNKIEALDPSGQTFQHLTALRELHLQDNKITKINKYSFLTLVGPFKTVTVYLGGNPIQCDCDIQALMSWSRSLTVGKVEIRSLRCANDQMKPFEEVDDSLFKQCTQKSWKEGNTTHKDNNTIAEKQYQERHAIIHANSLRENIHRHDNEIMKAIRIRLPTKDKFENMNLNQDNKKLTTRNLVLENNNNNKGTNKCANLTVYHGGINLIRDGQGIEFEKENPETINRKSYIVISEFPIQNKYIFWFGKNQRKMFLNGIRKSSANWHQISNGDIQYNKYTKQDRIKNMDNRYQGAKTINNKEDTNQQKSGNIIITSKIRQRNIRETAKRVVKRQEAKGSKEPASENNENVASQNNVFGSTTTCPTCKGERTNHGCNLHGAQQCYGEQMACHKTLEWDGVQYTMKITSTCDNYTSCMVEETKNQHECGIDYQETAIKVCHFCCYGPTCTTASIGGRTKDFTFTLNYIRDNAVYEPYMADHGHPSYLQEEERIDEGVRKAVSGLLGGLDVYLIRFAPQQNQQCEVVLRLQVTTFSFVTEEKIKEDIIAKMLFSLQDPESFFSSENIVADSLNLAADNQDPHPCPEETSHSADKGNITWHASPEGKVFMLCPYRNDENPGSSNAVRTCLRQADGSVAWGPVDYSSCSSKVDQEPVTLDKLFETPITTSNAKAVSAMLNTYTMAVENLTGETVNNVVNKLEMLLQDSMLQQPDVVNNLVECLSSFINSDERFATFEQRTTLSQRLLNIIDLISERTPLVNGKLMVVTANLAIVAQGVNASEISDVALTVDADSNDGLLNNSKINVVLSSGNVSRFSGSSGVVIPTQALVASMTPEERLSLERFSFVVHQSDTLFATIETNETNVLKQANETESGFCQQNNSLGCQRESTHKFMTKINSQVISASVPGVRVAGLKENITMNFIHDANATNPRCVFWNTNTSTGTGEWSGEGCGVVKSDSGETTCGCNHLTNFALIMDVYQGGSRLSDLDRKILSIISYVGCGVSLIALILTLLTYSCFRKLRRDNPSKILINLCLALMLSNLVYLVGMQDYTFDNTASCKVVAVLLHYFLLASLTWMAVEAFYMYLALILVFKTYFTNFILKCCLVGWGVPFVIVIITLGVNSTDNYGILNSGLCWLRNPAFYAAFVGPVCLILLVNFLAFGLVMRQLVSISSSNLSKTDRNSTIHRLRGAFGVVVLLGLSWLFAIFAIGQASVVFYYLFAVFNSMQGLFIFIFYCLLKKDAVVSWKRSLPCFEEYGETSKTSSNSRALTAVAATHHMAKHNNHSRSESSTFLGNTVSVTSTLIDSRESEIDSRKNSCYSTGLNNNPYDSSEEYETPLKTETAAAATEYKHRLSPILSSERKNSQDFESHNPSTYSTPETNSQSQECEDPNTERSDINISLESLDYNCSQVQPELSGDVHGNTPNSSPILHVQRSSDLVREDSIQLELPDTEWSYSCHKDNKSSPRTFLSRCEGDAYSGELDITESNLGSNKLSKDTKDIFVTHL